MEVAREHRHVVPSRAQGRKSKRHDRKAVIEVLAERAVVDAPGERAMVAAMMRTSTERLEVVPTRRTVRDSMARRSLGWSARGISPNLVEEERAPVRLLEDALAVRRRAR